FLSSILCQQHLWPAYHQLQPIRSEPEKRGVVMEAFRGEWRYYVQPPEQLFYQRPELPVFSVSQVPVRLQALSAFKPKKYLCLQAQFGSGQAIWGQRRSASL